MSDPGDEMWDHDDYPPGFGKREGFCDWESDGGTTTCRRCGCSAYHGLEPTCPPFITRCEPDNSRLPHITSKEKNRAEWERFLHEEPGAHDRK